MPFDYSEGIIEILPVEIWNLIIDFLRYDSWSSLRALSLSSRAFYEIVSPVLFKTVHIYFPRGGEATGHLQLEALLSPHIGRRVHHHVRIFIVSYGYTFKEEYSEMLYALVEKLPNLQIIRWRIIPFPPGLFSNLMRRHSPPVLYYEGDPENFEAINNNVAPFIKSASLTFAAANMRHVIPAPQFTALCNLLPSLSHLTRLALKYYSSGQEKSRPILDLPPGSSLASVEDLALANFKFSAGQAASWIRALESGTRLRRLALHGSALDLCEFIHQLSTSGVSVGLTSFSLRVHDSSHQPLPHLNEALISLLRRTTNLAEFLAYDLPKDILHTVTSTHGGNIRRLRFRRTNYTGLGDPDRPGRSPPALAGSSTYKGCLFTPDELQDLARQVPHLERLGIDLCSVRELPLDLLDAIASFPSLKFVEINTPHSWHSPSHYRITRAPKTRLDVSLAEQVFRHIADRKDKLRDKASSAGGDNQPWSKLMGVDIKEGEWEPLLGHSEHWRLRRLCIYACWCDTSGLPGAPLHTLQLSCNLGGYANCVEDNMYEQTMIAAGLWNTEHADFGPAI